MPELKRLARKTCPFEGELPSETKGAKWLTPQLVAEVAYAEFTAEGRIRHGAYQGLREDKEASDVSAASEAKTDAEKGDVGGVADLQRGPRGLSSGRADQGRGRGVLRRGGRAVSGNSRGPAGVAAALSLGDRGGVLLPETRRQGLSRSDRHGCRSRRRTAIPRTTCTCPRPRRCWARCRWERWNSTSGGRGATSWSGPTGWSSTSTPTKATALPRW